MVVNVLEAAHTAKFRRGRLKLPFTSVSPWCWVFGFADSHSFHVCRLSSSLSAESIYTKVLDTLGEV